GTGQVAPAPVGDVMLPLALLVPGGVCAWMSGKNCAADKEVALDEKRLGAVLEGRTAVRGFLLGAGAAGPPQLPPEVTETVMPLDLVPASGGQETVSASRQEDVVAKVEEKDEEVAQQEVPKGDDHLTKFLLALSMGGAVWI